MLASRTFNTLLSASTVLLCALAFAVQAGTTAPVATSDLTDQDVQSIKALLSRLSDGFKKANAAEMMTLFGTRDPKRRERIRENLEHEFQALRYVEMEFIAVVPDESMPHNRHSLDVSMRMITEDLRHPSTSGSSGSGSGGGGTETRSENSTTQTFIVHKQEDGSFVLIDSPFFDKLGLQQGVGLVVDGLLAVMGLIAGLAFWVWMGFEVHRARPRSTFWRALVFIPVIGPVAFFVLKYLPGQLSGQPVLQ